MDSLEPHQVILSDYLSHLSPDANQTNQRSYTTSVHLIVLNWALPRCLVRFWDSAVVRVCADGGANRLYDELPAMMPHEDAYVVRKRFMPDIIHGDLDSLRPDIKDFYCSHGVQLIESGCQETTDLTKCITLIEKEYLQQHKVPNTQHKQDNNSVAENGQKRAVGSTPQTLDGAGRTDVSLPGQTQGASKGVILALGALGGRLDHTLANLNTLHMHRHLDLALVGEGNLVRLVRAGRCVIKPDRHVEGPLCGLVPMSGPAVVTMKGFKWDLDQFEMKVGGLVSTSNEIAADELYVESDTDLIWTVQLAE